MKTANTRILSLIGLLLLVVTLACRAGVNTGQTMREENRVVDPASAATGRIGVVTDEFEVRLEVDEIKAGTITFVVTNEGHMQHDFAISGEGIDVKTEMIDPGETVELEVTLKPGTYEYICTIPGHTMLGMRGEFSVTS